MASEREPTSDFRKRLAAIPKIEDAPVTNTWEGATPPVVRPPAPVARPKIPGGTTAEEDFFANEPPAARNVALRDNGPATTPHQPEYAEEVAVPTFRKRRRKWPLFLFLLLFIAALVVLIPLYLASQTFGDIDRVEVSEALVEPLPAGTNLLLIGTDSRDGIDGDTDNAGLILGEGISGERTDTIMVLRVEEEGSKFLSLPRDLWLPINGGDPQRINAAFAQGPEALINTVQTELGIPISHYVQVDLAGFIDLVDAVGGVEINIPNPAFDRGSGLDLPTAGTVTLDSTQALAFVRSRFYTEIINGAEVADPTSDLGRVQRQQDFLRALMLKISEERNPATLNSMSAAVAEALVIDDGTSLTEALTLANSIRTSSPESVTLPTSPTTTSGGAAVLTLNSESPAALAQFGG